MPQITVTIDDDVYMDIIHNLPKGMKSRFVNMACRRAVELCAHDGRLMHTYARKGPNAANAMWADMQEARNHPNQTKLGVEEE